MVTKTKPKPSSKTTAAKGKATGKAKAPAASKPKTKPEASVELLAEQTFVKFKGYAAEMAENEIVFAEGDVLFIVGIDTSGEEALYDCIPAAEVPTFLSEGLDKCNGAQVAPREVSALTGSALDKARDSYMPITMVGSMEELLDEHDGDPIAVADAMFNEAQQSYFYLGGALAMALQQGSYLKENGGEFEGEDAFNDFCQEHFGFKASKGRQLARVYSTMSAIPDFDPASLDKLSGWSIAAKIERYVTADNWEEVFEAASEEGVTQRNVDAIMQDKFVSAGNTTPSGKAATRGGDKIKLTTMSFRLAEDSAETVSLAIAQCKKQSGIADDNLALEKIVVEWAQDHVEGKTAKQSIASKSRKAAKARELAAAPAAAPSTAKKAPARKKAA